MSSARAWRWTSGLTRLPPPMAAAGAGRQTGGRAGGRAGGVGGRWVCSWELGPVEQSGWKGAAKRGWAVWAAACRRGLGAPWPPRPAWPCQPADCHPPCTPLSHRLRLNLPPTTKPHTTRQSRGPGLVWEAAQARPHFQPPTPRRLRPGTPCAPSLHPLHKSEVASSPSYYHRVTKEKCHSRPASRRINQPCRRPAPHAPRPASSPTHAPTKPLFTAPARTP